MSAHPDPSPASIGDRLRQRRKEQGLTLQQVADGAGLSTGFISQLERGITAPSLSSLVSVAQVLDIPLGALLEQRPSGGSVTRQNERAVFKIGKGPLGYERLSAALPGSRLRSVIIHEPPGHRAEPISHEGEELMFLLSGRITVEVEGERTVMGPGDSIHFLSSRTHSTWNHGSEPAAILWCGTMDVFGEDPGAEPDPIHRRRRQAAQPKPRNPDAAETARCNGETEG